MLDLKNATAEAVVEEKNEKNENPARVADIVENVDKSVVGINSNKIALIATVCDPSVQDVDKTSQYAKINKVIGYAFKALEDVEVPEIGCTLFAKSNKLDYDERNINRKKLVKKGEEFYLTFFETAKLLMSAEFNAKITGVLKGSFPAVAAITYVNIDKGEQPEIDKSGKPMYIKSFSLRAVNTKNPKTGEVIRHSVRALPQIPVIDIKDTPNGRVKSVRKGFEKWAAYEQDRAVTVNMVKEQSGLSNSVIGFMGLFEGK